MRRNVAKGAFVAAMAVTVAVLVSVGAAVLGSSGAGAQVDAQEPNSTVTQPAPGSSVTSPITARGSATDDIAVTKVRTAVRNQTTLLWLQADGTFGSTFRLFDAQLTAPGARSTSWSWSTSLAPGSYGLSVRAVDGSGRAETSTPWVTFTVVPGQPPATTTTTTSTTTSTTTTTTTTAPPSTTTTTSTSTTTPTTAPDPTLADRWAFWGYLFSDGSRLANGTWRWDQAPHRYAASATRFQRGAAALDYTVHLGSGGAYVTDQPIAAVPDPRTAGSSAVEAFLAATIEDEAVCGGMVFDNPNRVMVEYVRDLYRAAEPTVPTVLKVYGDGFAELSVLSANWPLINAWPYATTVRTPGAPNCTLFEK
jgi:hypothetical protein